MAINAAKHHRTATEIESCLDAAEAFGRPNNEALSLLILRRCILMDWMSYEELNTLADETARWFVRGTTRLARTTAVISLDGMNLRPVILGTTYLSAGSDNGTEVDHNVSKGPPYEQGRDSKSTTKV